MLLQHSLLSYKDFDTIYDILESGKLKPSSITKNVKFYPSEEGSPYIFFNIKDLVKRGVFRYSRFLIDSEILLDKKFCLNVEWVGDYRCKDSLIDGKKLTKNKLDKILEEFINKIKKLPKSQVVERYSHEILILKSIDLKKYLKKVYISFQLDEEQKEKMKKISKNYPGVKFVFKKIKNKK